MDTIWIIKVVCCLYVFLDTVDSRTAQRQSCPSKEQYACIWTPYMRHGPRCIPVSRLCDGRCDCPLADDERFCYLIKPTVTVEETNTLTTTSTQTSLVTITPTACVNATSDVTIVTTWWFEPSTTTLLYTDNIIPAGSRHCSVLTSPVILGGNIPAWRYTEEFTFPVQEITFSLPCSVTTKYP